MYSAQDLAWMKELYGTVKRQHAQTKVRFHVLTKPCLGSCIHARTYYLSFLSARSTYTFSYYAKKPIARLYLAVGVYTPGVQLLQGVTSISHFICKVRFTTRVVSYSISKKTTVSIPSNIQQLVLDHYSNPFEVYRPNDV